MGYPMTWKRIVNRNGLGDGDYTAIPMRWRAGVNLSFTAHTDAITDDEAKVMAAPSLVERIERYEKDVALLAGDLRRLEADATDELLICKTIAHRLGVDEDTVAAVLKEFISW